MSDATLKKVIASHSPPGEMAWVYLVTGKRMSMRLWKEVAPMDEKPKRCRPYETTGYVFNERAALELADQKERLEPGDAWGVRSQAGGGYVFDPRAVHCGRSHIAACARFGPG